MPKAKSRKSILNRVKITKRGKLLRRQSFRRHLKSSKSAKRLKNLRKVKQFKGYYAKKLRKALGVRH